MYIIINLERVSISTVLFIWMKLAIIHWLELDGLAGLSLKQHYLKLLNSSVKNDTRYCQHIYIYKIEFYLLASSRDLRIAESLRILMSSYLLFVVHG